MSGLRYIDVCSGISAPTMAWKPLGWEALCFAEIEAAPRSVLAHHYPDVPLRGDFTEIEGTEYGPVDLLVGGTPCQSFSIAGLRGGLGDDRGNLALEFARLADRARPRWVVWENVPGVLSSNGGRDFGSILGALAELGYGVAYRVLDAQHFGVPQRRRRVFVVGHLGDWRRAAAVLFERHSLSGHSAPRREKGQTAPTIPSRSTGGGGLGTDFDCDGGLIAQPISFTRGASEIIHLEDCAHPVTSRNGDPGMIAFNITPSNSNKDFNARESERAQALTAGGNRPSARGGDVIAIQERAVSDNPDAGPDGAGFRTDGKAYTLEARTVPQAVAFAENSRAERRLEGGNGDRTGALSTGGGKPGQGVPMVATSAVRRLTPRECERLQGFPEIHRELRITVCSSEDEKRARAQYADKLSPAPILAVGAPVAVHALIDLERQRVQLHSLGRSPWSASIAELAAKSPLPIPPDAFARLLALMHDGVGPKTRAGGGASLPNTQPSTPLLNGSVSALLCGSEISELASDADRFTAALTQCSKFTTSLLGETPPTSGSIWETLACCVSAAISGFIPDAIRSANSYELRIETHCGFTLVPHRGKPMADGPRYKALGNSMAVPVLAWIGQRIEMVEQLAIDRLAA